MAKTNQSPQPPTFRRVDTLIIHCAATPNGKWFTVEDIDLWHKQARFKRGEHYRKIQNPLLPHIGYHFVIYPTGAVATGRHLDEIGAHAKGFNRHSIGICLIGTDKYTLAQWESLKAHITGLQSGFERGGKPVEVIGHNEINHHKTCPGFDVGDWVRDAKTPLLNHILEDA